jgi:predicted MFS family arabinose efflux permease
MAPSALSLLTTTFGASKDRGRAFGIFGAIAGAGGALGLLLGGVLTEYLSWRWCLYVNLIFAAVAVTGAAILLRRHPRTHRPKLDVPGALFVSSGMFCIVFGFSNAATHGWHAPATWGFLIGGLLLLAIFAWWETRAAEPLLPLRIVLDRNRGGAYLSILIAGSGLFGIFLFVTYYMQQTLSFSPVTTGLAFLPMIALVVVSSNLSNIVLMPRFGPRPIVTTGMLLAAGGMAWLTRIGVHSSYAANVLPPLLVAGAALGIVIAPSINTGTFGIAPQDAGVASASVNTGQQLGGSIGTSLLNTVAASATAAYLTAHVTRGTLVGGKPSALLTGQALVHGYTRAFWWSVGIFVLGAIVAAVLFRWGPLSRQGQAAPVASAATSPAEPGVVPG